MFNAFRKQDPDLNAAIAEAYRDLKDFTANEGPYSTIVDQIVQLNTLKNKGVDPNTLVVVVGNLLIGFAVIKYERTAVVTTKLWSFMSKL